MTLALPPARTPHARRQIIVGTALGCAAGTMLIGGMLAVWLLLRQRAVDAGEAFTGGAAIPEVAGNVMLITILAVCVFVQWSVYAAKRGDRANVGLSLGITTVMALAFINAQAFIYYKMELVIGEGTYPVMFYSLTGTMLALVGIGVVFTAVTVFRYLGGRTDERELVSAHALYWYFVAAAFVAVWFVVYVTK